MLAYTERIQNKNVIVLQTTLMNVFSRTMENNEKLKSIQKRKIQKIRVMTRVKRNDWDYSMAFLCLSPDT